MKPAVKINIKINNISLVDIFELPCLFYDAVAKFRMNANAALSGE